MHRFFYLFYAMGATVIRSSSRRKKKEKNRIEQTVTKKEQKITGDTKYILEIYNEDSGELTREQQGIPSEYIGMERKELESYLKKCVQAMAADEQEAGLSDMRLISFSSEEIILRKYYREPEQEKGFFLRILDGEVAIYDRSGNKLYEKTGISVKNIPEEEVKKLKKGYIVENEKDLYSILENFSS